jgi:ferredoxin
MDTLIIGSGLSAVAVYKALTDLDENQKIYIIDTNIRHKNNSDHLARTNAQKSLFGSDHMYEQIKFDGKASKSLSFSHAAGGLSTVWGAGIRLWDPPIINEINIPSNKFYAAAKNLLSEIPYFGSNQTLNIPLHIPVDPINAPYESSSFSISPPNHRGKLVNFFETPLAVYTRGMNSCVGCGLCITGCPYGSIFNAGDFFDGLMVEKKITRIQGKVKYLNEILDKVQVNFENKSSRMEVRTFDKVIVCAGAIGTPIILMASDLVGKEIVVKDSQVFYFIGVYRRKKSNSTFKFSLSQKTITDSRNFSASIYECNSEVRLRISNSISQYLFGIKVKLPKFLDNYLFLGIGFLDSDLSGKINLRYDKDGVLKINSSLNSKTTESVKDAVKRIAEKLRQNRLRVIPWLTVTPPVGAGFHSGAGLPSNSEYVDELGRVKGSERIRIGDVGLLPKIFAGSHTFNSMSLNYALIMQEKL